MSGSASHPLTADNCIGFRRYCSVIVFVFLGCAAVGRVHAQNRPPAGDVPDPGAAVVEADSSLLDTQIGAASTAAGNVTTFHYDRMRTGWNPNETILTPGPAGNVKAGTFGLLQGVRLGVATGDAANDYVDAQPLVVK